MNKEEALKYVFQVLQKYYNISHNKELGILLADLDPWYILDKNAKTADPAAWHDWLSALQKVTINESVSKSESQKAILLLMQEYNEHHGFELKDIIEYFSIETHWN
jgi:hypothetical protein